MANYKPMELTRGKLYRYEGPKSDKTEIFQLDIRDEVLKDKCNCSGYFISIKKTIDSDLPLIPKQRYVEGINSENLSSLPLEKIVARLPNVNESVKV